MNKWPNFFIIGAPKCGTSSMFAYLSELDELFLAPVKEPNFFSTTVIPEGSDAHPIRNEKEYLALFSQAGANAIRGEASTTYLLDPNAPREIKQRSPEAKIVVMLRDPVDLAFSFWLMQRRNYGCEDFLAEIRKKLAKPEPDWFENDLKLEFGFYAESLERYLEHFSRTQVHIVIFEEFRRNSEAALIDVARFLGVEYKPGSIEMRVYNAYGEPRGPWAGFILGNRKILNVAERLTSPRFRNWVRNTILLQRAERPTMDPEGEKLLVELYRQDVVKVEHILQRRLPWRKGTA